MTACAMPDHGLYGIAIYNFKPDVVEDDTRVAQLRVNVGEALHLTKEHGEWYYASLVHYSRKCGYVPKSYVQVVENCLVEHDGIAPTFVFPEQPPIVHEITLVLREWSTLWQNLYIAHREQFDELRKHILELINHRSKIISGTLPVDELKEVTCEATKEIALGNKLVGLDLVVRDVHGNTINSNETSTTDLYSFHQNATESINNRDKKTEHKETKSQIAHIFVVSVQNFTYKMTEDAELLMFLYDAKEFRAITENYIVQWSKEGLMTELDKIHNLKVMFTDLGKKDLERERVFLVCNVVRVGAMEAKDLDHRRSSNATASLTPKKSSTVVPIRRPCGVAAKDVTAYLNGSVDSDLDKEFSVPFFNCDKDNLHNTLKNIIKAENKNESQARSSLYIGVKLLHGDIKQVRDENPHLVLGNVNISRKMGFPEVILPGEIRNDLYLTLLSGEFSKGNKKSDKNIEVCVTVCNAKGEPIPHVIFKGDTKNPMNDFKSVVYYHEAKPQWSETFKVAMPIEEFKRSHVKFTFKHRSSNEAKDKSERPFAFAYVNLMQKDDTTLRDGNHSLNVYKYDYKKYEESNSLEYMRLPSVTTQSLKNSVVINGITLSMKDNFTISSNVCSTKLTQNVNILDLLNWTTKKNVLNDILYKLMAVEGEEIVKFLTDILDTLFNILMEEDKPQPDTGDSVDYDQLVFDCLLHITGIVTHDWRYQHFEPVLNLYIKENYSATLAYNKMLGVLCNLIEKPSMDDLKNLKNTKVFRTMKSFQYIMRFITQSRRLHSSMKLPDEDVAMQEFTDNMDRLFNAFIELMTQSSDNLLREQGACLKYLPGALPDILNVYSARDLSLNLCKLFNDMPTNRLTKQKVMTMNEIVQGPLFKDSECRMILLPHILEQLKSLLVDNQEDTNHTGSQTGRRIKSKSVAKVALVLGISKQSVTDHTGSPSADEVMNVITEMDLCLKTLGDMLTMLFHIDSNESYDSIAEIIRILLRTVSVCYIKSDKDLVVKNDKTITNNKHEKDHISTHTQSKQLAAILIDIFRQMTENHYRSYMDSPPLKASEEKLSFIIEMMTIFKEFVDSNMKIFPDDWCDMKMLQNQVILKALRYFSYTIRDDFTDNFHHQIWSNFFQCAISYLSQPSLQLETFTANKQMRISKRYKDMRREMGFEVLNMWFNLGQNRRRFVPSLVENILEMTLIPEVEMRKATIPIFFDMMQCEFYSSNIEFESFGDTLRNSKHVKGNFNEFEREMIIKLDTLFEGGRGDEEYRHLFLEILGEKCRGHARLGESGTIFVTTLSSLMDRLLTYRMTMYKENKENKMACIVNLLDFYAEISRKEMYIRYVYKLYDLHLELGNHTEAAFTLELHSDLLSWTNDPLPPQLRSNKYEHAITHMELKELLCTDIIENYDKGKMWECAIAKTKELILQYEQLYYYDLLGPLQSKIAGYYNNIMTVERYESEYFRVGYYGLGFPKFLQNKVFVYRGTPLERLAEFQTRICRQFPKAELCWKLKLDESAKTSNNQYLLINKVVPIEEEIDRFNGQIVSDQIAKYYKWNNVNKFYFSRQFKQKDPKLETQNDFGEMWIEKMFLTTEHSFPHILCWYPVKEEEIKLFTPVQNAIETMQQSNETLKHLYKRYKEQMRLTAHELSLKLKGILDPKVQGGISNYEQYFFTPEYLEAHPEEAEHIAQLKELIAEQNPLLELCVEVHSKLSGTELQGLHQLLEECYLKHKNEVHEKYGVKDCNDFKNEVEVRMRRANKLNTTPLKVTENTHHSDNLGNRSRVSSITRAQVQSFKNLTSSFNFSASSANQSELNIFSRPVMSGTKSLLMSPSRSLTGTPGTLKKNKNKDKRRASKTESTMSTSSMTTQWYTVDVENIITAAPTPNNGTPIFELRQELTPKRPLRSEAEKEKRLSRPSSGQYSSRPSSLSLTLRATSSSGTSSNRDSIGTTDSSVSEEDLPPPLPVKLRELEGSLRELHLPAGSTMRSLINNHPLNYDIAPLLNEKVTSTANKERPPTPPPKPPKKNKQVS